MKKSTIISVALLILAGLALLWWGSGGRGGGPVTASASVLAADEDFYDFGEVSMAGGEVEHSFQISNPGPEDIELKKVFTSCMCTAAYLVAASGQKGPFGMEGMGYLPPANLTLAAGESVELKVVFDPNAHGPAGLGAIDRFVTVTDSSGGALRFELKGVVTP